MRLLAFVEYAALIIGLIAMIAGHFFALPKGFQFGVFMIGAGIALGGLEGIFTRRMGFRPSEDAYEAYAGAPAVIVGLMALLVGAAIIGAAYLLADGLWHSTLSTLSRRPAAVLAAAGLLLVGTGVLMMLNPQGRRGWAWTLFIYIPRSLAGLVVLAAGFAAIGLGAWEWREPQAFDAFAGKIIRMLPPRWRPR